MMMERVRCAAAALCAVVLAGTAVGCSTATAGGDTVDFLCNDYRVSADAIESPLRPADAAGAAAIEEATLDDGSAYVLPDPETWNVIVDTDDEIALIRPKSETSSDGDFGDDLHFDHELVVLTTDLWPGWAVGAVSGCALTVDLGDLGVPLIALDPDHRPVAGDTRLQLLVLDPSCGGNTDMPGRIEVVDVIETDAEVRLLLGVQPLPDGAYDCAGFPPTPFTVDLDAPLDDRVVVDASRALHRELTL